MRHFGPVVVSKVCDNPTCENHVTPSDTSASYSRQTVVTYTGSAMVFTYCSNRCVNADCDRSADLAESESHYCDHVMALEEDAQRDIAAEIASDMPTRDTYTFEGESFEVSGGFPVAMETGIRCGCCGLRHSCVKAVKFCYVRTREVYEEMEAEHAIEIRYERWLEDRYA